MSDEDFEILLKDVKSYLNITWEDERTEKNLTGIIKRGVSRLKQISGVASLNFAEEDLARHLLLDYCRYANSHILEAFEENFRGQLISLNLMNKVNSRREAYEE